LVSITDEDEVHARTSGFGKPSRVDHDFETLLGAHVARVYADNDAWWVTSGFARERWVEVKWASERPVGHDMNPITSRAVAHQGETHLLGDRRDRHGSA
jgi:hypothetical protein